MTVASLIGFALVVTGLLFLFQRRMIYFPRPYESSYRQGLPKGNVELPFKTRSGRQTAFYVPSGGDAARRPQRLWVCFMGNASLALDWLDVVEKVKNPAVGFLLIDYPGYGLCEGNPTRRSIREASDGALHALGQRLGVSVVRLERDTGVLGLSIGTAPALEFAVRHSSKEAVLLAPFTSLMDMARRQVGWPLCLLLRDRWDNAAQLDALARRNPPPRVVIYHGEADSLVPFAMGQSLAARHPGMVELRPIPGADHIFIFDTNPMKELATLLSQDSE